MKRILSLAALVCSWACGSVHRCEVTVPGPLAVQVTVVDSVTGSRVEPARIILTKDGVTDTTTVNSTSSYPVLIGQSGGLYHIVVQSVGYATWTQDVQAPSVACDPVIVDVTARLRKSS